MKIHIISLGCSKNLVDSESMAGILCASGHTLAAKPEYADVIIINTCAFVDKAAKESRNAIRSAAKYGKKMIVCGCLPQISGKTLSGEFSGINAFVGTGEYFRIAEILEGLGKSQTWNVKKPEFIQTASLPRKVSTGAGYAYLKISEGCNNLCSYCLIPEIRGRYRSRTVNDIIKEAEKLAGSGIKELIIIGQDTTAYPRLPEVLKKLSKISGIGWIRLLYTHPKHFSDEIIDAFNFSEKICKYIDLPLQHTRDEILMKMGRPPAAQSLKLIEKIRGKIPGVTLRTTVMAGFPGETEKIFSRMLKDLSEIAFDWLGCFEYSPQKETEAAKMPGQIPEKEKKARYGEVMALQQRITALKNSRRVGKKFKVLADSPRTGHAEFQCPEIDGKFLLKGAKIGQFAPVVASKVHKVYDLIARKTL